MHAVAFSYVPCWPAAAPRFFQVHLLFNVLMWHDCLLQSFCMFPILHLMIVSCLSLESAVWCFMLPLPDCCCVLILVLPACCWFLHMCFMSACCLCVPDLFMSVLCWFVQILDVCLLFSPSYVHCVCDPCLLLFVCTCLMSVCFLCFSCASMLPAVDFP